MDRKMMQNVHLAPENDEDDLYSGYNDYNPMFDTEDGVSRPMTAVQAAGYTKTAMRGSSFDPLGQARGPASPLEKKNSDSPEEKLKQLEKKVNELVEESCVANSCGDLKLVLLNLASQYAANEMYAEALTTYQVIVKNKMFTNGGILKVNMGNIYLKQRNYSKAIKFYRMALDQITSAHKEMRMKIMENIGVAFIKTGQFIDAVSSFEDIMSISPNLKAGFNLILCYFAIGDGEQMKKAFKKLIAVPLEVDFDDKYISLNDDLHTNLLLEAIKNDSISQMERERKSMAEEYIMTAAKLIAPVIETSFAVGYDWCVDAVKASHYVELANDLEINKATTYLRQQNFNQGNELAQATNYADLAINSDRYNPAALTNKGNTVFANGDYEKAAEFYKEALRNDSLCTEALYNLGLAYKKLNRMDEALDFLLKLHAILPNSAQSYRYFPSNIEVIEWLGAYCIDTQFCEKAIEYFERAALILPTQVKWQLMVASCYRRSGNYQKALEKYKVIHRKFPENVECLQFLVRLCTDMGLKEVQEYVTKLKKVEKLKEIREQRIKSGRDGSARNRREGGGDSGGTKGERLSAKLKALPGANEPYESRSSKEIGKWTS
ncbi:Intraflagellar transport protein 88 like protein [Pitangus sulphuratus]|nr:Intraflagellar transport protein 88 like protein [Pitangus sulphuratus]